MGRKEARIQQVGFLRRKIVIRDKDIFEIKRLALHKNCHYQKLKGCYVNSSKEILATIDENFLNLMKGMYENTQLTSHLMVKA